MTYQELKERLTKCEIQLEQLKGEAGSINKSKQIKKLEVLKESLESKIQEAEKTAFVNGQPVEYKDEEELQKFKDNSDVSSIRTAAGKKLKEEEEDSEEDVDFEDSGEDLSSGSELDIATTIVVSKKVGKALVNAIKRNGDGVQSAKANNIEPNSFSIQIVYQNDNTDSFLFKISGNSIILNHGDDVVNVGEIKPMTSGEAIVHDEIISGNIYKYFQILSEEKVEDEVEEGGIPVVDDSDVSSYAEIKEFMSSCEQDDDLKSLREGFERDEVESMNDSIHAFLGSPDKMPSPIYEGLDLAARDAVDFYWDSHSLFESNIDKLVSLAKTNYLKDRFSEQYSNLRELFSIKTKGEYDDAIKRALEESATKIEESKYKFKFEVASKDSLRVVEFLDQEYSDSYKLVESNVVAFQDLKTAYNALQDVTNLQLSVNRENITENIKTPDQDIDSNLKSVVRKVVEGIGSKFKMNTWESLNNVADALYYIKEDFKNSSKTEIVERETLFLQENNETPETYKPGEITKSVSNILNSATILENLVKKYDRKGGEVSFPYWVQQKVNIAKDYVSAVQEYVSFEDKKPGVDLLTLEEETLKPYQHYTIKEMVQSVGRKPEEVYDLFQPKIVEGKGQGSLKLKGGDTVIFKKEYGIYSITGGSIYENIQAEATGVKLKLVNLLKEIKQSAKRYESGDQSLIKELRKKASTKKQLEEKYQKIYFSVEPKK